MPFVADNPQSTGSFVPDKDVGNFVSDREEASALGAGDRAAIEALIGESRMQNRVAQTPLIGYGKQGGGLLTIPAVPELPQIALPGVGIPMDVAAAGVNTAGTLASSLTSPDNITLMSGAGLIGRAAPIAGRVISGAFAADMGHSAYQQIQPLIETIKNPGLSRQQKLEAGGQFLGTLGMTTAAAIHAISPTLGARIADKTPDAQAKAIREAASATEDARVAQSLTDAADALEKQLAAKAQADAIAAEQQKVVDAAQKQQAAQQKAAADIQKAQAQDAANAQKAAAAAQEVPKSTQILQEAQEVPSIANIATEIGTQTSPFEVQGKINEMTAPQQISGQEPAAMQAVAGGAPQGITGPSQEVVNAPTRIPPRAPIQPGETIEAAVERLAANGETALAIAARVNSSVEAVRDIAKKNGIAIAMKSKVKPDIVMTPAPEQIAPQEPVGIAGPRNPEISTGTGVPTKAEEVMLKEQNRLVEEYQKGQEKTVTDNAAFLERFKNPKAKVSVRDIVEFAAEGGDVKAYAKSIGFKDIDRNLTRQERDFVLRGLELELKKQPQGEPTNATTERIQPENNQQQYQRTPLGQDLRPYGGEVRKIEGAQAGGGNRPVGSPEVNAGNEVRQEPLPESLAPSRELKLNNADIGLTPVSAMKRPELIAELEAGGATATPKGIPLADANSAQLMDAVGKMRRGQYEATTDIIETLRSKKIRTDNKLYDATGGLVVAAHNAALDVAIAGIRAGRAIAEIIQMAVAKLRAMNPRATDEQIAALTKDIQDAHTGPAPRQSEADFLLAEAPALEPVAGRAPEATQQAAARRNSFAQAEAWADRVIKERGLGSGALNTLDPELLTAHTVKLVADLGRGAVDFAKWSADKIKEAGEAIRPYLQQIWDEAHKAFETQRTMAGDERGVSRSALGKYDYIKTSNKGQIEAAQPILDYVKATGDYSGGFARLAKIENTADRGVAAAVLLNEAESIPDPYLRDRVVARLAREAKGAGTDAAQGLQAQGTVNEILAPYRGHLAWMDIIQSKLSEKVGPIFGPDAADKVKAGFKEAGNQAAAQIDAPGANSLLSGPISRIKKSLAIDWRAIFTDLPERQAERRAEIFNRIKADPKIAALPPETQAKLAESMEAAWEHLRNNIFRQDFSKLVPLPNIPAPDRIKLEETLPELTKQANLGLLDNEAFLNAMADKYGIDRLDSATGAKLRELGQKAARTPEGSERNAVFQEILDTIMHSRGVKPFDFLTDFWYRNVMSAPRTAVEIGAGGIIQGAARTFLTAADTAIAQGRPDIAFRMTAMFMRDMGAGVLLGADLVRTGDRTSLPRYTEQFLAKMDNLEKGKSPGGEIESLYRRSGTLGKIALAPMEMVGRALTALDYIGGQGVRQQQMLYAALTRGDKKSFDAAMKQFDARASVEAWRQARKELPQGRTAQILARAREIMNQDIDADIRKFGNQMTEVTALNAVPVGISGLVYRGAAKLPMWVRAPTGLGFVKAALNLAQEYSNYAPITGQVNALRTILPEIKSENAFNRALSLKDLPPERKRQIIAAQATGLALLAAAANKFLRKQPEDDQNKPRQWDISGSWMGLTPTQKSALMSAGEKPYAIKLPNGRWVDYKLTPYLPSLAMVGHMRDQERFNGKKWNDEEVANRMGNAWLGGLAAVKDLSLASQFSDMAGILAADDKSPDMTKSLERKLANTIGGAATGLIPMGSLLREIDTYTDPQRYRADSKNPGVDLWLKQVPFVRRNVGEGPLLNFLGEPVKVPVTPFNRHIGESPSTNPVERALSDKVAVGMKLPAIMPDTSIVTVENGKPVQRPMNAEENYFYEKSVRQAYARQLASDLPAFIEATPEQAALYSQSVFANAERYVRDRMNTGKPFDGVVPVDTRLSSALTPEYQQTKELNASESAPSALAAGKLRMAYDSIRALPANQRTAEYQRIAKEDPQFAVKLVQYATAPSAERDALEKSEAGLGAESRAQYVQAQLDKLPDAKAREAYLRNQVLKGLLTNETLMEMAKRGGVRR